MQHITSDHKPWKCQARMKEMTIGNICMSDVRYPAPAGGQEAHSLIHMVIFFRGGGLMDVVVESTKISLDLVQ